MFIQRVNVLGWAATLGAAEAGQHRFEPLLAQDQQARQRADARAPHATGAPAADSLDQRLAPQLARVVGGLAGVIARHPASRLRPHPLGELSGGEAARRRRQRDHPRSELNNSAASRPARASSSPSSSWPTDAMTFRRIPTHRSRAIGRVAPPPRRQGKTLQLLQNSYRTPTEIHRRSTRSTPEVHRGTPEIYRRHTGYRPGQHRVNARVSRYVPAWYTLHPGPSVLQPSSVPRQPRATSPWRSTLHHSNASTLRRFNAPPNPTIHLSILRTNPLIHQSTGRTPPFTPPTSPPTSPPS